MRVCLRCGTYSPPESAICDGCGAEIREHSATFELPAGEGAALRAAIVRLERECEGCGRVEPVDGLPPDGVVRCRCGRSQRYSDADWARVLEEAHAVADLHGESPEGFEASPVAIDEVNPYAERARTQGGVVFAEDEADAIPGRLPRGLRMWVGPGLPIAPDSAEPFEIVVLGGGRIRARSTRGRTAEYRVDARYLANVPLVGALSEEGRGDRSELEVVESGGQWACPSCGAEIPASGSRRARCPACGVTAFVPSALRRSSSESRAERWWLLFLGPSSQRRALERDPGSGAQPGDRPLEALPFAKPSMSRRMVTLLAALAVPGLFVGVFAVLLRLLG